MNTKALSNQQVKQKNEKPKSDAQLESDNFSVMALTWNDPKAGQNYSFCKTKYGR